jgi:hypothetical protein
VRLEIFCSFDNRAKFYSFYSYSPKKFLQFFPDFEMFAARDFDESNQRRFGPYSERTFCYSRTFQTFCQTPHCSGESSPNQIKDLLAQPDVKIMANSVPNSMDMSSS